MMTEVKSKSRFTLLIAHLFSIKLRQIVYFSFRSILRTEESKLSAKRVGSLKLSHPFKPKLDYHKMLVSLQFSLQK